MHPDRQRDSGSAETGIRAEQVKLLYRQFPSALLATVINAVILAAALWGHADGRLLLGWLAALSVIYGARYLLLRAYFRAPPADEQAPLWGRRFVIGAALGGAVWGAAGLLLFPLQSPLHQILVPVVLAGMCAAGISTLSSWRHAYAAFLLPAVLPFAGRALWQGDTQHVAMGLMTALFIVMMLSISRRLYLTVAESLRLRFRNLDLLEAVRRSEQKLAAHVQRTPLAVIEWDLDLRVVDWNPGAEAVFGFSRAQAVGRHALELLVPEYERERVSQVWQRLIGQINGEHIINDNLTVDGRIITCEWFNTPLVDEQGRVIGVASLARDITERRRAQAALQRAHDELEQRVAERTEALTRANRALQEEIAEHKRARQTLQELSLQHAMILESAGERVSSVSPAAAASPSSTRLRPRCWDTVWTS